MADSLPVSGTGKGEPYRCSVCRRMFAKGRTDQEADAEALARFGAEALAAGPVEVVCEECAALVYQWLGHAPRP